MFFIIVVALTFVAAIGAVVLISVERAASLTHQPTMDVFPARK